MAFFKRELGPIERFENALKEKLAARQKLAERLSVAEAELAEKRTAAERLAVAGAPGSIAQKPPCAPSKTAPRHGAPNWWSSTSRSPQPSAL
jgi:hypothetical protein